MTQSWLRWLLALWMGSALFMGTLAQAQERPSDVLKRAGSGSQSESTSAPTDDPPAEGETAESEPLSEPPAPEAALEGRATAIVIPVDDEIGTPLVYILRRGLKEAVAQSAEVVILDIDTPGGAVFKMLEMMELLDRFDGTVIAYVNDEAISAGALIASVADEIWFAPKAVIGSAGIVMGGGEEVPETMKQKVESYVQAKLRALSQPHPYREKVVRAMMDAEYELVIDGHTVSSEGEMLNLTAEEALRKFGTPATPLFGDGIAENVSDLLSQRFGPLKWDQVRFQVSWSEELAKYLTAIAPLLMALGIVGLFIEFKTPGFGIFGIAGITCLAIVFLSNYVAGLAGLEPFLILVLGLVLIAVDIFLLPGTIVPSVIGFILVIGSLLWSMADLWPDPDQIGGVDVQWRPLYEAAGRVSLGLLLAVILGPLVYYFLLKVHALDAFILGDKSTGTATVGVAPDGPADGTLPAPGSRGVVTKPLHPGGEVEIDGERFQARVLIGSLPAGAMVEVIGRAAFGLEVREVEASA